MTDDDFARLTSAPQTIRQQVGSYAAKRMTETGLTAQGWSFRFNTNKTRAGVCKFRPKRIEISVHHFASPMVSIQNTINHEIAHALVGYGHGHNHVWRSKAIELGCDGQRKCNSFVTDHLAKWKGTCPRGHVLLRHRKPSGRVTCGECAPVFDMKNLVTWSVNMG